jgi:hypothetical protein
MDEGISKECIDLEFDITQIRHLPKFDFNKVGHLAKAAKQKWNIASEIFNALALFSRQLRNLIAMADKPLISFFLQGMSNVWNNVGVLAYPAHPSKYPAN